MDLIEGAGSEGTISEAAAERSRINGAKSRGPKTEEGKRISSRNAGKTWAYARAFRGFLAHLGENRKEFDRLRLDLFHDYEPADRVEAEFVEDMVEKRWELQRLMRFYSSKLVAVRRQTEVERQRRLATEVREVEGSVLKSYMFEHGVASLPDSKYKFERTVIYLIALRAEVEQKGFTEWGTGGLRLLFGESPSLAATELVFDYETGRKAEAEGNESERQAARQSFLSHASNEIESYRKMYALYREKEIEIPADTRDAGLLPDRKELKNFLRAQRSLELDLQLLQEQFAAWRQYKRETQAIDIPVGELSAGDAATPPLEKRGPGRPKGRRGPKA